MKMFEYDVCVFKGCYHLVFSAEYLYSVLNNKNFRIVQDFRSLKYCSKTLVSYSEVHEIIFRYKVVILFILFHRSTLTQQEPESMLARMFCDEDRKFICLLIYKFWRGLSFYEKIGFHLLTLLWNFWSYILQILILHEHLIPLF